jgi:hypothetical protein
LIFLAHLQKKPFLYAVMAPPSKTFLLILVLSLVALEGCLASFGEPKKEEPKSVESKEAPKIVKSTEEPRSTEAAKGEWREEERK